MLYYISYVDYRYLRQSVTIKISTFQYYIFRHGATDGFTSLERTEYDGKIDRFVDVFGWEGRDGSKIN